MPALVVSASAAIERGRVGLCSAMSCLSTSRRDVSIPRTDSVVGSSLPICQTAHGRWPAEGGGTAQAPVQLCQPRL